VVECDLAKVDVVGSNPIRRSKFRWRPFLAKFDPEEAVVRQYADEGLHVNRGVATAKFF
jgi:hypothetical protein